MIPTIRIISPISDDNQLGYVIINEADFDASTQELFDPAPAKVTIASMRDALTAKGISFEVDAKKADLQALLDAAQ